MILKIFGRGEESIQYVADRPAHDFRYSISINKLKALGFAPQVNFEKHLRETVEWYRTHESWWKPLKKDAFTVK